MTNIVAMTETREGKFIERLRTLTQNNMHQIKSSSQKRFEIDK